MSDHRIPAVDGVRAIALLGILLMNIEFFYTPLSGVGKGVLVQSDRLWAFLSHIFIHGKFWSLFSVLFGAGLVWAGKKASEEKQLARLIVLMFFGALHCFIWPGDILTSYAVAGILTLSILLTKPWYLLGLCAGLFLCSLAVSNIQPLWVLVGLVLLYVVAWVPKTPKARMYTGLCLWASSPVLSFVGSLFVTQNAYKKMWEDFGLNWKIQEQILISPSFIDNLSFNITTWQEKMLFSPMQVLMITGCMLFGASLAQQGFLLKENAPKLIKHLWWSLPLTLISVWQAPAWTEDNGHVFYAFSSLFEVGQLGQALGYLGFLLVLFYKHTPSFLATSGKCSLSVYVAQSLIGVILFQWAFVHISYSQALLLSVAVWLALVVGFHYYTQRFPSPLEYIWRRAVDFLINGKT